MKIRIATLFLTILCLSLTGFAQTIYNDGGIDGNDNGFFITGPNFPNFLGLSRTFRTGLLRQLPHPHHLEFGVWLVSGSADEF